MPFQNFKVGRRKMTDNESRESKVTREEMLEMMDDIEAYLCDVALSDHGWKTLEAIRSLILQSGESEQGERDIKIPPKQTYDVNLKIKSWEKGKPTPNTTTPGYDERGEQGEVVCYCEDCGKELKREHMSYLKLNKPKVTWDDILCAVAQGWGDDTVSDREMDIPLANAIIKEVIRHLKELGIEVELDDV